MDIGRPKRFARRSRGMAAPYPRVFRSTWMMVLGLSFERIGPDSDDGLGLTKSEFLI